MPSYRVLITGGAGYIGSHIAWACVDVGHSVCVLDNLSTGSRRNVPPQALFIEGNAADSIMHELAREADFIVHCAGSTSVEESVADPAKYFRNNTASSLNVIEAACASNVRGLVFSSTAAVYSPALAPLPETSEIAPLTPYGQSKRMTEIMLEHVAHSAALPFMTLRYFNVAGADPAGRTGQTTPRATHLVKVACEAALGMRECVSIFGTDYPTPDGTCVRDYIHVSDLADVHLLALDHLVKGSPSLTLNCGYGRGTSVREVLAAVEAATGKSIPSVDAPRRIGDAPAAVADPSLLQATLNWSPRFADIRQIAASAFAWERQVMARR